MLAKILHLLKLRRMDRKVENVNDDLVKAILKSRIQDSHEETVRSLWSGSRRSQKSYISQRSIDLIKLLDFQEDPEDEENE